MAVTYYLPLDIARHDLLSWVVEWGRKALKPSPEDSAKY